MTEDGAKKEEEPMEVDEGSVLATEALSKYLNLLYSTSNLPEDKSSSLRHSKKNLVTIAIGIAPDIEGTIVHEYCTGHCSHVFTSVFKEAFSKVKSRAKDLVVTIQTNPQAFCLFIQWAYKHHFDAASSPLANLISVWILANKLSIPELQNFTITAMYSNNSNLGDSLGEQDFLSIWKNAPRRSALRSFLVDAIAILDPTFNSTKTLSKEMLLDVIDVLRKSYVYPGNPKIEKYYVNAD